MDRQADRHCVSCLRSAGIAGKQLRGQIEGTSIIYTYNRGAFASERRERENREQSRALREIKELRDWEATGRQTDRLKTGIKSRVTASNISLLRSLMIAKQFRYACPRFFAAVISNARARARVGSRAYPRSRGYIALIVLDDRDALESSYSVIPRSLRCVFRESRE